MRKQREFHTVRGYQILSSGDKILTSSMEDYLEMISRICRKEDYTRISHIADKLNVRPSSVTKVVQKLKELELVDYEKYGIVRLTEKGKELGDFLLKRHEIIEEFLKNIGIGETQLKDTEMIEHDLSFDALEKIYIFNKFMSIHPDVKNKYNKFKEEFDNGIDIFYPAQNKL